MHPINQAAIRQATSRLATGADIKTAKPGARLRFGGGLYLTVSPAGTRSWQAHYHTAGRHQVATLGRWPDLGVAEAKGKRDALRRTIREGGDPAIDRKERRAARQAADGATVRVIGERWLRTAQAQDWSPAYATLVRQRLANHIYPTLGDRPVSRVAPLDVEALIAGMSELRAQTVHVRQHLAGLFDYAVAGELIAVNPVRKIEKYLPKRKQGDEREISHARVKTIETARRVLGAVETSSGSAFAKLAHRLIALTAVRKLEGVEAQWDEIVDGPDGMTWTIPAARMKGRRGQKEPHVIPLAPQAADVFRAAHTLASAAGIVSPYVFPGRDPRQAIGRDCLNELLGRALNREGLTGAHTIHGWRGAFSTMMNDADPGAYRVIDCMLAHRLGAVERRYNQASFIAERRRVATTWADALLLGAPSAFALAGLVPHTSNVVQLREAA